MDKANLGLEIGNYEKYLKAQGFVDIEVKRYFLPIGTWPEGSNTPPRKPPSYHFLTFRQANEEDR
jgi:hypothetical protein